MYNIVWQQARYFCAINNTRRNCGFIYCYHLVKDLGFLKTFAIICGFSPFLGG